MALEKCSGLLSGVTRLGMWVRDHRTLCLRGSHLHHSINVSIQHRPKKRWVYLFQIVCMVLYIATSLHEK